MTGRAATQENEPKQQRDQAGTYPHSPRWHLVFVPQARPATHQIQNQEESGYCEQDDVYCCSHVQLSLLKGLTVDNLSEENPNELDDRRTQGDDVERGEQKEHEREDQLDADFRRLFLRALATLGA